MAYVTPDPEVSPEAATGVSRPEPVGARTWLPHVNRGPAIPAPRPSRSLTAYSPAKCIYSRARRRARPRQSATATADSTAELIPHAAPNPFPQSIAIVDVKLRVILALITAGNLTTPLS